MHGAKCLAVLARSRLGGSRGVPVLVPVRASPVPRVVRGNFVAKFFLSADWLGLALRKAREIVGFQKISL